MISAGFISAGFMVAVNGNGDVTVTRAALSKHLLGRNIWTLTNSGLPILAGLRGKDTVTILRQNVAVADFIWCLKLGTCHLHHKGTDGANGLVFD